MQARARVRSLTTPNRTKHRPKKTNPTPDRQQERGREQERKRGAEADQEEEQERAHEHRRTYHSGKPEIQAPRSSLAYAVNSSWRISSPHSSITSRWTSRMMRPMSLLAASGPILPASLRWAIAFSQRASEQYLRPRSTTGLSRGARGGRLCMISWKRGATNLPLSPN